MSEYIIGDRIEPSAQPYTLTEREFTEAVGIRVYGTESGTGGSYSDGTYIEFAVSNSGAGNTYAYRWDGEPLYDGYIDIFEVMLRSDLSITETVKDIITATGAGGTALVGNAGRGTLAPFSFIYEGGTHMTTVTERIANITIDSTEEVAFKPAYPFYAVKGESIKATLIADIADDATQGVYSTDNGNGYTIIKNPKMETTLYLTGTGDVSVWGGENPEACPFV
jgi:hypothetical protein